MPPTRPSIQLTAEEQQLLDYANEHVDLLSPDELSVVNEIHRAIGKPERRPGDVISSIQARRQNVPPTAFGAPEEVPDPSASALGWETVKGVGRGLVGGFLPTSINSRIQGLEAAGMHPGAAPIIALLTTGPGAMTTDTTAAALARVRQARRLPSGAVRTTQLATSMLPMGPQIGDVLTPPAAVLGENRPPTPQEALRGAGAGGELTGMMVAPKVLDAAARGISKVGGKVRSAAARSAGPKAADAVNQALARGDAGMVRDLLESGRNPGERLINEQGLELSRDPAEAAAQVRQRMDQVHGELQQALEAPEIAGLKAPELRVREALLRPGLRDAAITANENLAMPENIKSIAKKAEPVSDAQYQQLLAAAVDGKLPDRLARSVARVEALREKFGGRLDLSPAEINEAKQSLHKEIDWDKSGQITEADRSLNAFRQRQAAGLRTLLDDLTAGSAGERSPITELNSRYGDLASIADIYDQYAVRQRMGTLPKPERTLKGRASFPGFGGIAGLSTGGPVGAAAGAALGLVADRLVADPIAERTASPDFAIKSARVKRRLTGVSRPTPEVSPDTTAAELPQPYSGEGAPRLNLMRSRLGPARPYRAGPPLQSESLLAADQTAPEPSQLHVSPQFAAGGRGGAYPITDLGLLTDTARAPELLQMLAGEPAEPPNAQAATVWSALQTEAQSRRSLPPASGPTVLPSSGIVWQADTPWSPNFWQGRRNAAPPEVARLSPPSAVQRIPPKYETVTVQPSSSAAQSPTPTGGSARGPRRPSPLAGVEVGPTRPAPSTGPYQEPRQPQATYPELEQLFEDRNAVVRQAADEHAAARRLESEQTSSGTPWDDIRARQQRSASTGPIRPISSPTPAAADVEPAAPPTAAPAAPVRQTVDLGPHSLGDTITARDFSGRPLKGTIVSSFHSKHGPAVSLETPKGRRFVLVKDLKQPSKPSKPSRPPSRAQLLSGPEADVARKPPNAAAALGMPEGGIGGVRFASGGKGPNRPAQPAPPTTGSISGQARSGPVEYVGHVTPERRAVLRSAWDYVQKRHPQASKLVRRIELAERGEVGGAEVEGDYTPGARTVRLDPVLVDQAVREGDVRDVAGLIIHEMGHLSQDVLGVDKAAAADPEALHNRVYDRDRRANNEMLGKSYMRVPARARGLKPRRVRPRPDWEPPEPTAEAEAARQQQRLKILEEYAATLNLKPRRPKN